VFNMGHRMEIYVPELKIAEEIIGISEGFGVKAAIIGHTEAAASPSLSIRGAWGELIY